MSSKTYRNILQICLGAVMVFAPLARGAVRIWAIAPIELIVFVLVFLWLWRVNNKAQITEIINTDYIDDLVHSSKLKVQSSKPRIYSRSLRKTALDKPILAFVVLAVISCIFSIYKYASIMEMLRLITIVGVFYLVVNNFDRCVSIHLVALVIIMGTGISLFGLAQYFYGLEHSWWNPEMFLASTYVNHNHFAGYLELAIPLAIGIFLGLKPDDSSLRSKSLILRFGLIVTIIIMFAALVFSQSRGAWVCLTISLIVMNIVLIRKQVLRKESLVIFLLLIIFGVVYIYNGYDALAKRLRTIEEINNEGSLDGRLKIWQGSIKMIKNNSLIGTGIGTFVLGFPRYRVEGLQSRAYYAHNDYLHMMAEIGVLALPLMLWMIWAVISTGLREQNRYQSEKCEVKNTKHKIDFCLIDGVVLGSAVGILSLALHGLVDFNFHIPANMLVVACLAGIVMRSDNIRK